MLVTSVFAADKNDEVILKSIKSRIDTIIQVDTVTITKTDTITKIDTVIVKEILQLDGEVSVFVRKSNDSVVSIDLIKKPGKKVKKKLKKKK